MRNASARQGFTLIELLTVIAIIAVLAAILFPVAGTVREQARSSACLSNLHQLYVSANVYKEDEGGYPPALLGYAEMDVPCAAVGSTIRAPYQPGGAPPVSVDQIVNGFLYREQVRDSNVFKCPDNTDPRKQTVTVAYYPPVQTTNPANPSYWPAAYTWIGDLLQAKGCPSDAYGTMDCFWEIPASDPCLGYLHNQPRYFYTWDSYDISPAYDVNGISIRDGAGNRIFLRRYSTDWTGTTGITDLPMQLKYASPPTDKTLLAACTWHVATAGSRTVPAITLAGTAKPMDRKLALALGANLFNR